MISYNEALELVLSNVNTLSIKEVDLLNSLNCICATDIISPIDMPLFDNSSMDGYAICYDYIKSTPIELNVIQTIMAGDSIDTIPNIELDKSCIKIMTGARIPLPFDTVIPIEDTKQISQNTVLINTIKEKSAYVRKKASYFKKGSLVLKEGQHIGAGEIGLLASLGINKLKVYGTPKIVVITTGNELIDIDKPLTESKIYNANLYILASAIKFYGAIPILEDIVPDDKGKIIEIIKKHSDVDIIVTTGGVSMGEYDYVLEVLKELKFTKIFHKVAIKPGKPLLFGKLNNQLIFGVPGNPAASLLTFELFLVPTIRKMKGSKQYKRKSINAILTKDCQIEQGRLNFFKAYTEIKESKFFVTPKNIQESGDIFSFTKVNSVIVLDRDKSAGDTVEVIILEPYSLFFN